MGVDWMGQASGSALYPPQTLTILVFKNLQKGLLEYGL